MLLVIGNLTVSGTSNSIVADKNLPALYVTGDLIVEKGAGMQITGLAVVGRDIRIGGDTNLIVNGGLFVNRGLVQITPDSSGNGNTGTLYGPSRIVDGSHTALRFDGTDDYVGTGKQLLNNMSAFTLMGWISAGNPQGSRIGLFGQNDAIEFGFDGGSIRIWTLRDGSVGKSWSFQNYTWHHVAARGDGSRLKIYIDGQDVATGGSGTLNYGSSIYGFNIGGKVWDTTGNWFNGFIDDVRIYNRAIDTSSIQRIYNGVPDPNNVPIAHWKFDEANPNVTITAEPTKTAVLLGPQDAQERWGQAAGAFFRSIKRQ
jgi:hypothetical protein